MPMSQVRSVAAAVQTLFDTFFTNVGLSNVIGLDSASAGNSCLFPTRLDDTVMTTDKAWAANLRARDQWSHHIPAD
jgi:hypothetical protein